MKPTVITANQSSSAGGAGGNGSGSPAGSGINIPINREYVGGNMHSSSPQQHQQSQYPQPQTQFYGNQQPAYGSPRQVPTNQQPQQHFQPTFGFEPDMDMDMDNMFPRSRMGRMHHDPFAGFGSSHFGFPQLSTMGRRGRAAGGANSHMDNDDDFFNRLPSEFRQYIPEGFGARRTAGAGGMPPQPQQQQVHPNQRHPQQQQHQQVYQQDYGMPQQQATPTQQQQAAQQPSKRLCDAAIQTEDPAGRSEVDCAPAANLNQHGLRNTMDMGVKSAAEQDQGLRSHSAPPPEQQQLNQQYQQQQHQQRATPPHNQQFATQTSPPVQPNYGHGQQQQQQPPQFHKTYYAPQQQAHPQQKQQTPPPPQTPVGSYVRTIPIFVEGRTEPIINAHKEIPNQNAGNQGGVHNVQAQAQAHGQGQAQAHASVHAQAHQMPPQQQQRPGPINTQQQQQGDELQADGNAGVPPQTPHTQDLIKKIQDIQRDVLELMARVEEFKGTRQDKEYVYLDEMLTRNLLKLDTIDTNGKESIRLARKQAIKCIQASVNVLDAKAEENGRAANGTEATNPPEAAQLPEAKNTAEAETSADAAAAVAVEPATPQPVDATKIQEPIPLPPPPSSADGVENVQETPAEEQEPVVAGEEASTSEETTKTVTASSE